MSSLYYQHQQHEQQHQHQQHQQQQQQHDQLRREREREIQQHQYHQQQLQHQHQHQHETRYHDSQSQRHYEHDQSFSTQNTNHIRNYNDAIANPGEPTPQGSISNGLGSSLSPSPARQPGQQSRDEILDTLLAMMSQERTGYNLDSYFPREVLPKGKGLPRQLNIIHGGWREKICQWSYNVVDHFDLPREIVSISLNYFDRYMATLSTATTQSTKSANGRSSSPQGSGDLALLASLGTLHLASKVHATNHNDYDPQMGPLEEQHHKVPSLSTLANLSRGQFGPASILEMEKLLLSSLDWRLHPPTLYAFVSLLLKLLPSTNEDPNYGLKPSIAIELFEVAMYVAELSVCDAFFVERQIPPSTIALAAICTAMGDLLSPEDSSMNFVLGHGSATDPSFLAGSGCFTETHRALFMRTCAEQLGLGKRQHRFAESLERLRSMYLGASALGTAKANEGDAPAEPSQAQQAQSQSRARTNSYNPPTSPSSIADMSLSTINSTIHSMADTTLGGGSGSIKRGDSMVSSIAYHSKESLSQQDLINHTQYPQDEEIDHDYLGEHEHEPAMSNDNEDMHSQNNSHASNNFRYSPSPPREGVAEPKNCNIIGSSAHEEYPYHDEENNTHNTNTVNARRALRLSCSPIMANTMR